MLMSGYCDAGYGNFAVYLSLLCKLRAENKVAAIVVVVAVERQALYSHDTT